MVIGTLGQQPMAIVDPNVAPHHAVIRKTADNRYQIVDNDSSKGVFVFGLRVVRKTVDEDTPFLLGGTFKTSVRQLLQDPSSIDLAAIWRRYDTEKRKWERKASMVTSVRYLAPTLAGAICLFLSMSNTNKALVVALVVVVVLAISLLATERIKAKKDERMAELNEKLRQTYLCPHCHRFLGFTPYSVLMKNLYCPKTDCNFPLP